MVDTSFHEVNRAQERNITPRVVLRIYSESLYNQLDDESEVVRAAVMCLEFDYLGTRVGVSDRRDRFFVSEGGGTAVVPRNREAEVRAQCVLEKLGAVELECCDELQADIDSLAQYVVYPPNVHQVTSFLAAGVPELRQMGWEISIADDFPFRVASPETKFYGSFEPDQEDEDWFSLELGIEYEGRKISILPALLELLEGAQEGDSLESLLKIPTRFRAIPVAPDVYLSLPPARLRSLCQIILEVYRGESLVNGKLRLPRSRETSALRLEESIPSFRTRLPSRRAAKVEAGSTVLPPHLLNATLRPYQQEGVDWLQNLRAHALSGVLADDMGLGKTLQTIAHLTVEKASGRLTHPCLVVVPTSLSGNWEREIKKFSPSLSVVAILGPRRSEHYGAIATSDVVITTYPIVLRDLEVFQKQNYHYLILDEAQTIKNPKSQAHSAVSSLTAAHRLCLSGTPVENNLLELWSLFEFLMPGFLGRKDNFRANVQLPIERDGSELKLEALRSSVSPFILRRKKEQVARDLPPKTELVRPVEIEGEQRDLYESIRIAAHTDVRHAIRTKGVAGATITIFDALMKLRQVCCDPRLVRVRAAQNVRQSAKLDAFLELVSSQLQQGRRILVFSQFTRMLALISGALEKMQARHLILTGETQNRQALVDAFEEGKSGDVFLISLKAGGTGLNLVSADTVIHYDPWWNAAAQAQATDRAYRIGQKKPVFVHNLIISGSVEERMLRLQQKKSRLSASLLSAGQVPSLVSAEDLEDLFAPLN